MWIERKILRIPWTDKTMNVEVLNRIGEERKLLKAIKFKRLKYFRHIIRHFEMQRQLVVDGRRGRGQPRIDWVDNIKN